MNENIYILPEGFLLLNGKYRIERHLSSGGFGNTYKATTKIGLHRYIAIKEFFISDIAIRDGVGNVIVPVPSNVDFFLSQKAKFLKEAQRIANLHNQHIVRVHDVFEENGTAYYAMDFIEGESLMQVIERMGRPLSEDELKQMLPQILDALKTVHNNGLLHLDIKPHNIMFGADGVLKLIDFGASKQNPAMGKPKTLSAMAYTEGYAPMEQISQDMDKLGPWTDIYALGATMLHLLSNNVPPKMTEIIDDTTPDKRFAIQVPSTVSKRTRDLILWMMSIKVSQRPQSVGEICKYLGISGSSNNLPVGSGNASNEAKMHEQERPLEEEADRKLKETEEKKELQRKEQQRLSRQQKEQQKKEQRRKEQQRKEQQRKEQQRKEQQRKEQQRLEQQRKEQQRFEQQRKEQEKLEQERKEEFQRVDEILSNINYPKPKSTKNKIMISVVIFILGNLICLLLLYILKPPVKESNNVDHFRNESNNVEEIKLSCPDENHPHAIDLGLPSGTKWACCNVETVGPEAYGYLYAWGETEVKNTYYDWKTYIYCDGSAETCHSLGSDISGTKYDVAHVKWGGAWVMPTKTQIEELIDNCIYKWTTLNGVEGGKFTGKNGGSIFLPASGHILYNGINNQGICGNYWSSTQTPLLSSNAYYLYFDSGRVDCSYYFRSFGFSVRPVSK